MYLLAHGKKADGAVVDTIRVGEAHTTSACSGGSCGNSCGIICGDGYSRDSSSCRPIATLAARIQRLGTATNLVINATDAAALLAIRSGSEAHSTSR